MEGTGETSGSQEEKEMQGRRRGFLPCFEGRRMQQSCEVLGRARAGGLRYRWVAKDVWQRLGGMHH